MTSPGNAKAAIKLMQAAIKAEGKILLAKECGFFAEGCDKTILAALEKQMPKNTHPHHGKHKGFCPSCLSVEDSSANYCRVCGQALNWAWEDFQEV